MGLRKWRHLRYLRNITLQVRTRRPRQGCDTIPAAVVGPPGSVSHLAPAVDHISRDTQSPPMPILIPEPIINLSSAQWELPETISVNTEDIDPSVFDISSSHAASTSTSSSAMPPLLPSLRDFDMPSVLSRVSTPLPRQMLMPSPAMVLAGHDVPASPETTVGPDVPDTTDGPVGPDVFSGPSDSPRLPSNLNFDFDKIGLCAGVLL